MLLILIENLFLAAQETVRKAQEELAKQKEVIMAKDKELKVRKKLHYLKMFHTLPHGSNSNGVVLLSSCVIH